MDSEYKQKDELPDLYNILGLTIDVCKDPNCDEIIQKAYVKKAKACHPDRHPGRKDVAEVFELINNTYDILKNEKSRDEYNHKLTLNKQSSSDFTKLKKGATGYVETIGQYTPPTDQQKLSFKEQMKALDAKHGYDSSIESAPISKQDAKKKMLELTKNRAVQDVKLKPEKLFDEREPFNNKKFNEAFDRIHKRDNDTAMIPHNGVPLAWNDMGTVANFSSFDNLDNLYVEDNNRLDTSKQAYASINFDQSTRKMTKKEMAEITGEGANYVDGHDVLGEEYYKDLKQKLRERESDGSNYQNMKFKDYKRSDTAGYGIFDQLGFTYDNVLSLDTVDEDDISKKFERLMAERQKDISMNQDTAELPSSSNISNTKRNQNEWR